MTGDQTETQGEPREERHPPSLEGQPVGVQFLARQGRGDPRPREREILRELEGQNPETDEPELAGEHGIPSARERN